jgi:hypothetical protein
MAGGRPHSSKRRAMFTKHVAQQLRCRLKRTMQKQLNGVSTHVNCNLQMHPRMNVCAPAFLFACRTCIRRLGASQPTECKAQSPNKVLACNASVTATRYSGMISMYIELVSMRICRHVHTIAHYMLTSSTSSVSISSYPAEPPPDP